MLVSSHLPLRLRCRMCFFYIFKYIFLMNRLNSGVINNVRKLYDESRIRRALILSWHVARLSLCKIGGVPVCQRSSVRWSVWWKSSQNRVSSQSAALRSSTCGGSTCCTLCGPTQANSQVFKYNVDFTYDLGENQNEAVFVLYISICEFS